MKSYYCYSCDKEDPCILTFKAVCPVTPDQCVFQNKKCYPDWIRKDE